MTGDDLIAMHKATVRVIEDLANLNTGRDDLQGITIALRDGITVLAVVQRDILAGTLKAAFREQP